VPAPDHPRFRPSPALGVVVLAGAVHVARRNLVDVLVFLLAAVLMALAPTCDRAPRPLPRWLERPWPVAGAAVVLATVVALSPRTSAVVEAALGVVQHVPGVAAARLQRLHVVLDADDRVCEAVNVLVVAREAARAEERSDVIADAAHHLHRAVATEQQEARGDAARKRGCRIEAGRFRSRLERLAEQLLDAREVHDALAKHRLGDLPEVGVGLRARRRRARRHDEAHERVVEAILDAYQRGRDRDEGVLLGRRAARDDVGEARKLALDLLAYRAEAQHRERVADLLEEIDLRRELLGRPAFSRVEVERVLDAAEVLLDRSGDRAHEADGRRGKRLALLLDRLVDREQLAEAERAADRVDAFAASGRSRHVIKEVVQELDRGRAGVGLLALGVEALQLAVGVAEQSLDGDARLEPARAQRIEQRARDPPELV